MAKKQYLDYSGLQTYDEQIKAYINAADTATSTSLTNGDIVVKEAQHATNATNATNATHATSADSAASANTAGSATKATQDGNGKVISSTYETKTDATSKLTEAKGYTDTEIGKITAGTIVAGKATKDGSGNTITSTYETKSDATAKLTEAKNYTDGKIANLLDNSTEAVDSIMELAAAMEDNADAIEALNGIVAGKAPATHSHGISDVTNLQSTLNAKAAQSSLDSHTSNGDIHVTTALKGNWNTAYTHSQASPAPVEAEKNQNAFSNVKVGSTTVAADKTTDTIEFAGTNVTITPDATNDKVTFAVADGTTGAKGVVQLTDSTSSTSTTTAATPKAVKSAYDLANTAKTNAATAQSTADGAATVANEAKSASTANTTAIGSNTSAISALTGRVAALEGLDTCERIPTASITALFS